MSGGSSTIHLQGTGDEAATTLQEAYDAATAPPQIVINATPDPLTLMATVAGPVFAVQDTVGANIFEVDDTFVEVDGQLRIVDAFTNHAAPISLTFDDTFTTGGGFIGGALATTGVVTYNNSLFIVATFAEGKTYRAAVAPGFAAYTVMNILPAIENAGNFDLVQAIGVNMGSQHRRITSGTSTTAAQVGLNFSPSTRANVSGAIMNVTAPSGLVTRPTFSTVAGSTINFGTVRGHHFRAPAVAIFASAAGAEGATALIGLDVDNLNFGGTIVKAAVRSAIVNATNAYMLLNLSNAPSEFGNGRIHVNDNTGINYGGSITTPDVVTFWAAAGSYNIFFQANADTLALSNSVNNQILIDGSTNELTFNTTAGFAIGAQTGTNGNHFGNFTTPARTIPVGGDWSDFLLTQGGNLTVDGNAMGRVSAWVVNHPSYANSTGSVGETDTLTVGGFATSAPGVTITTRQSLNVIGGRSRLKSVVQYDPIDPAVLGSGNNNNWAGLLTGSANNNMRHWARITSNADGTSLITGIDATAAQDGDTFKITNVGAFNASFGDQDAASAAANRIITGTGVTYIIGPDETAEVTYDATTARWRILYGSGA